MLKNYCLTFMIKKSMCFIYENLQFYLRLELKLGLNTVAKTMC